MTRTRATEARREYNAHQRAAVVTLWLWTGSRLSNRDISRLLHLTPQGAGQMMRILSAALPVVFVDGHWQWMERD
jgi:hypothetical protein